MDKVFREKDVTPITHKEFNEFIKGKGFIGRNNYKLRDLKAMFGFKPMITGSPVTISSDDHQVGYSAGGYSLSPRWLLTWYIYPFFSGLAALMSADIAQNL